MKSLNEDLKTGQFKQIYLLYGEEAYLKKLYKNRFVKAMVPEGDTMNYRYFEGKNTNPKEIIDLAETLPFFAERRLIVMENSGLFKSGGEALAEYLGNPSETAYFIFVETEVDKRSKLYKTVAAKGYAAEFAVQDENTLKRWVLGMVKKEGKQISERTLLLFLEKAGNDMENIKAEAEKLFCYCMDRDVITEADVEAICTKQISGHIFDMVNAIADRKQRKALELYYELLTLKEPPMRIIFLIARQFNLLLQVKELSGKGYQGKTIGPKVGLPGFVAGKYVSQAARFQTTQLRRALESCVEAEEAVKTGRMNDTMSVELLIMQCSRE